MADNDSELGDFDPQNDSEAQPEEQQQPVQIGGTPATWRKAHSEYDRDIQAGDVVRDLWGGGWLIVFQQKAETVREYDRMQDDTKKSLLEYEGNRCMGATEDDAVFQVFYLNKNNTLAGGRSGPYSFPESRICRYAYEATDGWKRGRFQEVLRMQVLEQVADAVLRSGNDEFRGKVEDLLADAFDTETSQEAFELAEASRGSDGQ